VAQRYFRARRDSDGRAINFGVYLAGGQACGWLSRRARGATDSRATTVATLIQQEQEKQEAIDG
jgi:hypothetical protein